MPEKTFRIITLGCKVNQYESAYLEESLARSGNRRADGGEKADIVVVNTCVVTGRASYQSRQAIRRQVRENAGSVIAVTGCYAQISPEEIASIPGVSLVAGNTLKGRLPGLLCKEYPSGKAQVLSEPFSETTPFEMLPVSGHPGRTRAFLKIQDGCDALCSYCVVPSARGGPRSMDVESVVRALCGFAGAGFLEVVLTGVHLGRYGSDLGRGADLKALLRRIVKEGFPMRIRLSSLEPDEIDRELIDLVASNPCFCRHFHVAMQSGDDTVLNRMNRHYTAAGLAETLTSIREGIPDASIGTDLIVGFPGESEDMFENTRDLLDLLPVTYVHVFRFSPRPGTPAAGFPDVVPHAEAKARASILTALGRKKREAFLRKCLGGVYPVVVERVTQGESPMAQGLSDNYVTLQFPLEDAGRPGILRVRAVGLAGDVITGSLE